MKLTREIAFFDIEATGPEPTADRIVEISFVVMALDGTTSKRWTRRVNPEIPIPAEATAIHGITDDDVKDCPPFHALADRVLAGMQGKDLAGYNCHRYDCVILDEELRRCDLKLDLTGVNVIDCYQAFAKKHPRDLSAFVGLYAGRNHEGAHGAEADAVGTADGFLGLFQQHEDLAAMSMEELAAFTRNGDHEYADIAGKLYFDDEGKIRYGFGKNEGVCVLSNRSYAEWMLKSDFPASTKEVLRGLLGRTL